MTHRINQALCDVLGIDGRDVVAATLRMRSGKTPTVTVHRVLWNHRNIQTATERFTLVPADDRPLDLEAMALEARHRLAIAIETSAARHLREMAGQVRIDINFRADGAITYQTVADMALKALQELRPC